MCGGYQHFGLIFNVNDRHSGRCCGRVDDAPCKLQVVSWSRRGQCSRRSCWWRLAMQIQLPGNRNCLCRSNMQGTLWMLLAPCSAAFWIYAAVFVHSLLGNALAANQRKPITEIIIVKICRLSTKSESTITLRHSACQWQAMGIWNLFAPGGGYSNKLWTRHTTQFWYIVDMIYWIYIHINYRILSFFCVSLSVCATAALFKYLTNFIKVSFYFHSVCLFYFQCSLYMYEKSWDIMWSKRNCSLGGSE